jgi:hypothetical protein
MEATTNTFCAGPERLAHTLLGHPGPLLFPEVDPPESPFRAKGGQSEAVDIKAEVVDLQSPPLRRFSTADGTFPGVAHQGDASDGA